LVAYAEETGDFVGIRDAALAIDILDIDGDGMIGMIDFIHFAARLKKIHLAHISREDNDSDKLPHR